MSGTRRPCTDLLCHAPLSWRHTAIVLEQACISWPSPGSTSSSLMAVAEGDCARTAAGSARSFTFAAVRRCCRWSIVLYLLRHAGAAARRAADARRSASAAPAIQTAAAIRPVTRSRRYEKNRDASSTVHQRAAADRARRRRRAADRAPAPAGRQATWRRLAARNARRGSAPRGAGAERLEHVGADLERVAGRCRRRARPRASPGAQPPPSHSAATVASSTPPARPRQPACAAATARPSGAANSTGRQSATWTTQATPGSVVTLASASCDRRAGRGIGGADADDARAVHLAQEDRRGARSPRRAAPGCAATASGVVADRAPRFIVA